MRKISILSFIIAVIMLVSVLTGCTARIDYSEASKYINLCDIDKIDYETIEQLYMDYRSKNSIATQSVKLGISDIVDFYLTTEIVEGIGEFATYTRVENMCYDTDGNMYEGYEIGKYLTRYEFDYGLRWNVNDASEMSQEHRLAKIGSKFSFTVDYDESFELEEVAGKKIRYTVLLTRVYPTGEYISEFESYDYSDSSIYTSVENFFRNYESNKEVAEIGDWIVIDFEGKVNGSTFEGGSAEDYGLQLGNGYLFNRFESAMFGHKVGDVFETNLTVPSSYENEQVAGRDAVFTVKIKAIYDTEKTVKENTTFDTLYDLKNALRVTNFGKYEIMTYITDNSEITSYPKNMLTLYTKICRDTMETNISYARNYYMSYGMAYSDKEIYVALFGTTDLDKYADEQAKAEIKRILTGYAVLDKLGLQYTEEDYKRDLKNQTDAMNYTSGTSLTEKEVEQTYNKDRLKGYFIIEKCGYAVWDKIDSPTVPQKQ